MTLCEAAKAAYQQGGRRIYRKATGMVILLRSGDNPDKSGFGDFPTLEDVLADDWHVVKAGSERDKRVLL